MTVREPSSSPGYEIAVPGSISNLGPGFDTLSVAVQVYLRDPRPRDTPRRLSIPSRPRFPNGAPGGENRIETAFRHARARIGRPAPGVTIEAISEIPTRAGLGSSGAATIAGLRLYELLTGPIERPRSAGAGGRMSKGIRTTPPRRCSAG